MKSRLLKGMVFSCLFLIGCSLNPFSDADENAVTLVFKIKASEDLNPDIQGRPSPIEIRLYQLNSLTEFHQADFFDLFTEKPLASSLLDTRIFIVKPSEEVFVDTDLDINTQFIGVVAGYRDLDNAIWHDSIRVRDERGFLLRLIGSHKRMTLQAKASEDQVSLIVEQE
ncbi:type VI secretion system lipoprotein TssJ [Marinomonas sp. RSW2]|uniref:Type VI secretion system lipoprotein TssJ n=1 Tax=Marinomonas maritima TaxID=2940935 RepID=A0ABT5WDT8_9GAMM|nr:type VI secretion system lipoprotein TssJ [Marinomonas maritima]MDE8602963.1 type VI secretion system lipoprotein TssJ [Marinomonas maritima]